tara:strand:+ start:1447 stop:1713 length:267 start_codon:yes stop_codon:yes gene_type:complete
MADQINQKDADQDQLIALLTHRIEDAEKMAEELRDRVRKLEKWVWGAGAVITAAITLIGIATAVDAKEIDHGSNGSAKQEVVLQLPSS